MSQLPWTNAPLVLISKTVKHYEVNDYVPQDGPRLDYLVLAKSLNGSVSGSYQPQSWLERRVFQMGAYVRMDLLDAQHVIQKMDQTSGFLATSEKTALPIGIAKALANRRKPLVVVAHHLSSRMKRAIFSLLPLKRLFDHVICVSKFQSNYAVHQLGMPARKVTFIPDKVDQLFFRPEPCAEENYLLSVGKEQRDFDTLLKAVENTNIRLIIVAGSAWSYSKSSLENLPANVELKADLSYLELRALYARAKAVVVPLQAVDYAAGINGLLEGMAMGRPVIITRTPGLEGYVTSGQTALEVSPGSPEELRAAVLELWQSSARRQEMGAAARRVIETQINLDIYAQRVTQIFKRVMNENA